MEKEADKKPEIEQEKELGEKPFDPNSMTEDEFLRFLEELARDGKLGC